MCSYAQVMAKKRSRVLRTIQISTLLLAVTCNFMLGQLSALRSVASNVEISLEPDTRPLAPTVHLDGIRNGMLEGALLGDARFILGDEVVTPTAEGTFSVDPSGFLRNEVTVVVPPGAQFVASERGKYYYPVLSARGNALSPKTRIYFGSEEEAVAAGFMASH